VLFQLSRRLKIFDIMRQFLHSNLKRCTQLVELLVFLFLILPSLVLSTFVVRQGKISFILAAVSTILRNLSLLALLLVTVVAVSEETMFRGYLCLRLQGLTRNPVAAVLISSLLFALGHGYQGTTGLLAVGILGAALAVVYLWRGSLVAPMTIHFLQNFFAMLVLPRMAEGTLF